MSADESVKACPECDASGVYYRAREGNWYCKACQHTFDEPAERPPIQNGGRASLNGLPGVLADLDADAVGGSA